MRKKLITVLLVEDNVPIANRIRWHITKAFNRELQVLVAKTFKEAKEIIEQGSVDIFIIDFGLPDGDGEDLIKMIRASTQVHPIIAQTTIQDKEYQLKIFKTYGRIKYLTKDILFEELEDCLMWARTEIANPLIQRLAIPGRSTLDSINIYEICFVERIAEARNLHIELYDSEAKAYKFSEIKNMSLDKFMTEYNALDIFLRCHQSYTVNKKMVEQVRYKDNEILMLYRREKDKEVLIPIGSTYKKSVLSQLKGLN